MATLDSYLDDLLARGRAYFSRDEAFAARRPEALGSGRGDHALDQEAPLGESQARLLPYHPAPGRPNRQRAGPREMDRPADEASVGYQSADLLGHPCRQPCARRRNLFKFGRR